MLQKSVAGLKYFPIPYESVASSELFTCWRIFCRQPLLHFLRLHLAYFSVVFSFTYFDFFSYIKWVQYQAGNSDKFKLWKSFYNGIITWKGVQNVKPTKWQMSSTKKKIDLGVSHCPKNNLIIQICFGTVPTVHRKKEKEEGKKYISITVQCTSSTTWQDCAVFGRALLKTFVRKSIYILVHIIKCLKFPHILTWPVIIN